MKTIDIAMIVGLVLMVTSLILMYISVRRKSRRQKSEQIVHSLMSANDHFDFQVRRFDALLDDISSNSKKNSILNLHADQLKEIVEELECKRNDLEVENRLLINTNTELKQSQANLVEQATRLRNEMSLNEQTIRETKQYIDMLNRIKEGLEIALGNMQTEEIHYLSQPVFSLGITPSVKNQLESQGILYIGDLIHLNEQYLMEIWGIGPVTLERIKTKLNENNVWFGMDVIRVENHWYRRKQEPTRN